MTAPSDIVEEFGDTATVNESRPAAVSYRKIRDHIGPNSVTPITDDWRDDQYNIPKTTAGSHTNYYSLDIWIWIAQKRICIQVVVLTKLKTMYAMELDQTDFYGF